MKNPKIPSLLRTAGCSIALVILVLGGIQTASAFDENMRAAAYKDFTNAFWNPNGNGPGFFINQQGVSNTNQQMSFWQGAETIELVEDAVNAGEERLPMVTTVCQNYVNVEGSSWTWNSFNDDLAWACMAFERAYEMTGNKEWQTLAENASNFQWSRGWDTVNGGMYQQGNSGGKCTCGNANTGVENYWLYRDTGNTNYLARSQAEFSWIYTNDYNPSTGAIEQGPGSQVYFTYDNGNWATLCLYWGDTNDADKTFDWVTNQYGTAMESFGQGSDAGGFNGIGLRGLARTGHNIPFLQACCDRAWSNTNEFGLSDVNFGGKAPGGTNELWCWDASDMVVVMMDAPLPGPSIPGGGTPIALVNPSFETNTSGAVITAKVNKGYDVSGDNVAGWLDAGSTYNDSGVDYAGDNGIVTHSGNVVAYCDQGDSGAYQITGYQMNPGDRLTLTWWAKSSAGNADQSVKLLSGTSTTSAYGSLTQLAVSTAALTYTGNGGAYNEYTLTYTATNSDAGKYVAVSFMSPGTAGQWAMFDDFALSVTTIPNGTYNIVNQTSGLALDDPSGGGSGSGMDQQAAGGVNQEWLVTAVGGGQYKIVSAVNGLALSGPTSSNQLVIQSYTGMNYQLWTFTTNGSYYIVGNAGSGQVMDDSGASTSAGNPIGQLSADGGNNQNWTLTFLNYGTNPIPSAPTGLRATALNAAVALDWSYSAGATGYNVKRSTSSGGETTITGVSGTFYIDTTATNGTEYYYEVSAANFAGESANSSEVSATPTSGSLITNGTYNIVDLTSGLALDDPGGGGSGTGMDQRAAGGVNQKWVVTAVGGGWYKITSAVNGLALSGPTSSNQLVIQSYTGTNYQLWTFTPNGFYNIVGNAGSGQVMDDSGASTSAGNPIVQWNMNGGNNQNWTLTLLNLGTPAVPTGLNALALNASVALTWNSSAGATSYNVKRSTTSGGETTITNVTSTSYTDAGLANGTEYYYEVSATNSAGESTNSSEVNATTGSQPQITGIILNGTTLTISGTNGSPDGTYYLLMSRDLTLPLNEWTPVLTNTFDGGGNLNLSTNIVNPGDAQEFYILQVAQ